jgi:hypothetical protein
MGHVCTYNFRRNQLNDALNQINRAIQKNQDIIGENHHQTIDLYFKKALVLAKLRNKEEALELMNKTK